MTINNKSERDYRGKCLGWPVTSYGGGILTFGSFKISIPLRSYLVFLKSSSFFMLLGA